MHIIVQIFLNTVKTVCDLIFFNIDHYIIFNNKILGFKRNYTIIFKFILIH